MTDDAQESPTQGNVTRMTAREAAAHLGIHDRTVKKWLNEGRLDGVKEDGQWVVLMRDDDDAEHDDTDGPAPGQHPRPRTGPPGQAPVDLAPMADTIRDMTKQIADLSAASAMWQERAMSLQRRLDDVLPLLESGPIQPAPRAEPRPDPPPAKPKRGFWARLFLGPDPE
ncbi:MAG: helix-turn-helix domain-containing protein [Thermomicrobiales bacterium]